MAIRVWPVDAVSGAPAYSGRMLRQSLMAPLLAGATAARPLGARSGVRPGTSPATVTATSTVWTVLPHAGILDVVTASEAGPYGYAIDANVTGAITAANATNPRKDIVYVELTDPAESTGGTTPAVTPQYLAGTAAASPSAPATPARSMALAEINVPVAGGGSPTVTWVAPYTAAAGGVIQVRNAAEEAAVALPTHGSVLLDRLDLGVIRRGTSAGWSTASVGPWTTYSPTLTSGASGAFTPGSGGGATFQWRYEGDMVAVRFMITLGAGATMAQPRFSLPHTSATLRHAFEVVGLGSMNPSSQVWPLFITLASPTQAQLNYRTSAALLDVSLSSPVAFAAGNVLAGSMTYRPVAI